MKDIYKGLKNDKEILLLKYNNYILKLMEKKI